MCCSHAQMLPRYVSEHCLWFDVLQLYGLIVLTRWMPNSKSSKCTAEISRAPVVRERWTLMWCRWRGPRDTSTDSAACRRCVLDCIHSWCWLALTHCTAHTRQIHSLSYCHSQTHQTLYTVSHKDIPLCCRLQLVAFLEQFLYLSVSVETGINALHRSLIVHQQFCLN